MQQAASRSGESDMTASDAESWAKLRLVEGESSAKQWELVSSVGHTTMTVGCSEDCTWVVRGEGVRSIHFSLHWDGSRLRAADVYSAGDVRVDGVDLTPQWRALNGTTGEVRIEFGKAVMVIETSTAAAALPSSEQPLGPAEGASPSRSVRDDAAITQSGQAGEESPGPSGSGGRRGSGSSSPARATGKETLIGVAPQHLIAARLLENYEPPSVTSELPEGMSAKDARRAERLRNEPASMKATLVGGIGITPTPLSSRLTGRLGSAKPSSSAPGTAGTAKAPANSTLMGFNIADVLRQMVAQPSVTVGKNGGEHVSGGSLAEPDQRTVQGLSNEPGSGSSAPPPSASQVTGRRMTQQGMVSQSPGVDPGAVSQVPVRAISSAPRPASERIGSAWQERSDDPRSTSDSIRAGQTLRGVSDPDPGPGSATQRGPRVGAPGDWGREERFSDVPTQMRDPSSYESRRPLSRGFPWRYVGVLLLTSVAYFAWLYLLDHI